MIIFSLSSVTAITELQNVLSWKGLVMIMESNTWPCTAHPKNHSICLKTLFKCFLNISYTLMARHKAFAQQI